MSETGQAEGAMCDVKWELIGLGFDVGLRGLKRENGDVKEETHQVKRGPFQIAMKR